MKKDVQNTPWQICDIFNDVDDIVYAWETLYKSILDDHIKERKVKVRTASHPWMNSSLRKQMNLRFKLLQAAQKTKKGSHEWKLYRKARNHCTKLLRLAEASYWKNKFQGLSSSSKEFWKCTGADLGVVNLVKLTRPNFAVNIMCISFPPPYEIRIDIFNDYSYFIFSHIPGHESKIQTEWSRCGCYEQSHTVCFCLD